MDFNFTYHPDDQRYQPATFMEQIRAAASTPSPLSRVTTDPRLAASLRPKVRRSNTVGSSKSADSHESRRSKENQAPSVLKYALEAGDQQLSQLKGALLSVGTRLEEEIRRGDELQKALEVSRARNKALDARIATMSLTRTESEQAVAKASEDLRSTASRLEQAERELAKAQRVIDDLARERDRTNEALHRSKSSARKYEMALKELEGWRSGFLIRQRELEEAAFEIGVRQGETEERRHAMRHINNIIARQPAQPPTKKRVPVAADVSEEEEYHRHHLRVNTEDLPGPSGTRDSWQISHELPAPRKWSRGGSLDPSPIQE